jgi:hypothetical protein
MSDFLPSEIINHINSFCDNRTQYSIQHTCTKFYDRDILRKIKLGLIHNLAHQLCYRNRLALSRLGKRPLYNIINLNKNNDTYIIIQLCHTHYGFIFDRCDDSYTINIDQFDAYNTSCIREELNIFDAKQLSTYLGTNHINIPKQNKKKKYVKNSKTTYIQHKKKMPKNNKMQNLRYIRQ